MLGLRKQEDDNFMRFMELVQKKASDLHCVFFLDAALGDDISLGDVEGDNCTGWLIPNGKAELFNEFFKSGKIDNSKWDKYYVVAEPSIENGEWKIAFN